MSRTVVFLESPYAGNVRRNTAYARRAMYDSIHHHNEAPIATHMLYTQPGVLLDSVPSERKLGIECGFLVASRVGTSVFYADYGVSPGMLEGLKDAVRRGRTVVFRFIGKNP